MNKAIEWARNLITKSPVPQGASGASFADFLHSIKEPSTRELMLAYQTLIYACANMNAKAMASIPLHLYVRTSKSQPAPKCGTIPITKDVRTRLLKQADVSPAEDLEEVISHPLIDLLRNVNDEMDQQVFLTLIALYGEVVGMSHTWVESDGFGPKALWPLPPDRLTTVFKEDQKSILYYSLMGNVGGSEQRFPEEDVIAIRSLNLFDPYFSGYSPTRAAWQYLTLLDRDLSYSIGSVEGQNVPPILLSPEDKRVGPDEALAIAKAYTRRFASGRGAAFVTESPFKATQLSRSSSDLELSRRTSDAKIAIANIFGVPPALLDPTTTARANLEASLYLHAKLAILPRVLARDQALTHDLAARYDPRLVLMSEDPVPADSTRDAQVRKLYVDSGIMTVNEVRADMGMKPVEWGDEKPTSKPAPATTTDVSNNPMNMRDNLSNMDTSVQGVN